MTRLLFKNRVFPYKIIYSGCRIQKVTIEVILLHSCFFFRSINEIFFKSLCDIKSLPVLKHRSGAELIKLGTYFLHLVAVVRVAKVLSMFRLRKGVWT